MENTQRIGSVGNTVTITAGGLGGVVEWDSARDTYRAQLEIWGAGEWGDDEGPLGGGPGRGLVRFGWRAVELPTIDSLINRLDSSGFPLMASSADEVQSLGLRVRGSHGSTKLVGRVTDRGHELSFLAPSGRRYRLHPPVDHPDHGFWWGDTGDRSLATARSICQRIWSDDSRHQCEMFALGLLHEVLAPLSGDFWLDVDSVCDWWLLDAEPRVWSSGSVVPPKVNFAI